MIAWICFEYGERSLIPYTNKKALLKCKLPLLALRVDSRIRHDAQAVPPNGAWYSVAVGKATAFDSSEQFLALLRYDPYFPDGRIDLIDVKEGRTITSRPCVLSPNGGSICWSPDRRIVGTVESDGFHFYDATNLEEIARLPWQYPCHVEFSRDGKNLALGAWSGGEIRPAESVFGPTAA